MDIKKITNLDLIGFLENATELFRLPKYRDKKYVESFIGLATNRAFFYGKINDKHVSFLEKKETIFNSTEDVLLLIEGVVILDSVPINEGSGNIIYKGYGILEVDDVIIYDGRAGLSSVSWGAIQGNISDQTDLTDLIPQFTNGITEYSPNQYGIGGILTNPNTVLESNQDTTNKNYQLNLYKSPTITGPVTYDSSILENRTTDSSPNYDFSVNNKRVLNSSGAVSYDNTSGIYLSSSSSPYCSFYTFNNVLNTGAGFVVDNGVIKMATIDLVSDLVKIEMGSINSIIFSDIINLFGARYDADYSSIGTLDNRWIPDWEAVKNYFISNAPSFTNGITEISPNVYGLGGTITDDSFINGNLKNLSFGNNGTNEQLNYLQFVSNQISLFSKNPDGNTDYIGYGGHGFSVNLGVNPNNNDNNSNLSLNSNGGIYSYGSNNVGGYYYFEVSKSSININSGNSSFVHSFKSNGNAFEVDTQDSGNGAIGSGMFYSNDYSTLGISTHGDRWITDKGYVDSAISLASDPYFKGVYVSLASLQTAFPTGQPGWYAYVDTGVGQSISQYIWDNNDTSWVQIGAGGTETGASIVAKIDTYYSGDYNNFTDADKTKLTNLPTIDGVQNGLSIDTDKLELGGLLTKNTTINGVSGTYALNLWYLSQISISTGSSPNGGIFMNNNSFNIGVLNTSSYEGRVRYNNQSNLEISCKINSATSKIDLSPASDTTINVYDGTTYKFFKYLNTLTETINWGSVVSDKFIPDIKTIKDRFDKGTAKGDLLVFDGSSYVKLPVGTNGQRLEADNLEVSGLKWVTPSTSPGSSKRTITMDFQTIGVNLTGVQQPMKIGTIDSWNSGGIQSGVVTVFNAPFTGKVVEAIMNVRQVSMNSSPSNTNNVTVRFQLKNLTSATSTNIGTEIAVPLDSNITNVTGFQTIDPKGYNRSVVTSIQCQKGDRIGLTFEGKFASTEPSGIRDCYLTLIYLED